MAFPSNPITGTTYGITDRTVDRAWFFNGYAWQKYDTTPNDVYTINGITGISVSGNTGNVTISNTGVISINGATGAVTNINAATSTITNTNSSSTFYPAFVGGTGATGFFIDAVSTPLTYVPSSGTVSAKAFDATFTTNQVKLDASLGTIFNTDGTNTNTVAAYGLEYSGASPYYIYTGTQRTFLVTKGLQISDGDYDNIYAPSSWGYTFPASNGTSGQAMLTNGSGQLYWGTVSSSSSSGVSSFNGLTGAVGIAAVTNITITPSGNTFTISASRGGVAGFTLTTIDFSAAINRVQFDVFTYTASYLGTPVYSFATKGIVEQLSGLTAIMQNTGLTVQIVGTVETVESYRNSPMPTDIDFYHTVTMKPPFYGATSGLPYTAEEIVALNPTELLGSSWVFSYDPVGITNGISLLHKEETYVVKTITGQSWVAADTFINCKVLGLTTDDHDPEDAILEGVRFEINNIVPGTGFDIIGHAPEGTYGKYKIKCLGQ